MSKLIGFACKKICRMMGNGIFVVVVMAAMTVVSAETNSTSPAPPPPSSGSMFQDLPQGEYSAGAIIAAAGGGLKELFNMAEGFVNIVFVPFSDLSEFVHGAMTSPDMMGYVSANYAEPLKSQAGFLACLVFGFIFIGVVPVIGILLFVCRCFGGKCGGVLHQSQARSNSIWRQVLSLLLILQIIFLAVPMMLVFVTNAWITDVVKTGPVNVAATIGDMLEYFRLVPRQVTFMAGQYNTVDRNVRPILEDFGHSFGIPLQKYVEEQAQEPFSKINETAKVVDDTVAAINTVDSSLSALEAGMGGVDSGLSTIRNSMSSLNDPVCLGDVFCNNVFQSRSQLAVGFDVTQLSSLRTDLVGVKNSLTGFDLHGLLTDTKQEIGTIPGKTTNQTRSASDGAVDALNQAKSSISQVSTQMPNEQFDSISIMISDVFNNATGLLRSYEEQFDQYRYIGGAFLGTTLLFIVVCYLLGLILGLVTHDSKVMPTQRGTASNIGGVLLVVGSGLSFAFASLFMLLVIVLFLVGGHGERYLCQALSPPKYEAIGFVEELVNISLGTALQLPPGVNLSLGGVLKSCEQDHSVYKAFKLEYLFNVTENLIQVSDQMGDIESQVNSAMGGIDLSSTEIYSAQNQQDLKALSSSGIEDVDFDAYLGKLGDGITATNLTSYATFLRESAENFTSARAGFRTSVLGYADQVMDVQNNDVVGLQDDYDALKDSIHLLKSESAILGSSISSLDAVLVRLKDSIQGGDGRDEIERIARVVYGQLSGNITSYLEWAGIQVSSKIGHCRPMYEAYAGTLAVFCDYLIDTINGLWFSLGWAVFFLIPSAITALKLMKFFRKMTFDEPFRA